MTYHEATVATVVDLVASDELLLTEARERAVLDLMRALKGTGGGEAPAAAALETRSSFKTCARKLVAEGGLPGPGS